MNNHAGYLFQDFLLILLILYNTFSFHECNVKTAL